MHWIFGLFVPASGWLPLLCAITSASGTRIQQLNKYFISDLFLSFCHNQSCSARFRWFTVAFNLTRWPPSLKTCPVLGLRWYGTMFRGGPVVLLSIATQWTHSEGRCYTVRKRRLECELLSSYTCGGGNGLKRDEKNSLRPEAGQRTGLG